ncbi:hypothetical protein ETAA8_62140 [Anatilimnocola aggregata]|uniref:Uncharacterized protein n=1 Tax=Anatilimnocola aggregata TaxID=2528021 RepID=A0A517YLF6_9BACT|nr:hypothetical protein ETAA8_62140 [Anatilimnocola aggregata]
MSSHAILIVNGKKHSVSDGCLAIAMLYLIDAASSDLQESEQGNAEKLSGWWNDRATTGIYYLDVESELREVEVPHVDFQRLAKAALERMSQEEGEFLNRDKCTRLTAAVGRKDETCHTPPLREILGILAG